MMVKESPSDCASSHSVEKKDRSKVPDPLHQLETDFRQITSLV